MPNSAIQNLFKHGGLPKSFQTQTKTFAETCIMIRDPALEVIDILKKYDPSKPVFKFVLCTYFFSFRQTRAYNYTAILIHIKIIDGERGAGKSLILAHLIHYAHETGHLIVHVPWGK